MACVLWLHLKNEVSPARIDISWVEYTSVGIEATTSFMPFTTVKGVKIVTPVELKLIVLDVVRENLNVVVEDKPWHVDWVEASSPRVERGCPEVHAERLSLVKVIHSGVVLGR